MNQASDHSRSTIIVQALHSALGLFKVRREERRLAWGALLYALVLNTMVVCHYWEWFSQVTDGYRKLVLRHFHISGFDPITYLVLNDWSAAYNIYRHPLLAFFMWIPAQINRLIILATGVNFAQVLTALFLVAATFYAVLFLFRILREIVSLPATDALLLTLLFLSFAYTMVSLSVPDHFGLSTTALILTLYVTGRSLRHGRQLTKVQTVLLFLLTAGISLNNGIKVFLASWGTSGKRFFRPAHLLLAVIVPSALIWGFARWEWQTFEKPKYLARQEAKAAREKKERGAIIQNLIKQSATGDTTGLAHTADSIFQAKAQEKERRKQRKAVYAHQGKPMGQGEFSSWTDATTPRLASMIENFFGEPIQLHADHLLGDVLVNRPIIVAYRHTASYAVEAAIILFFLAGIWAGRRSRFLWIVLSWMGFDMIIHVVLGFGLNEVYIMSPHWLFVLPIAMGFALLRLRGRWLLAARVALMDLSVFLLAYNASLYVQYLFF